MFPATLPLPGNYVYLSNSSAAQLSAVQAGFGIGILSHRWAAIAGKLTRVLPDYTAAAIDLWLVTHEELRHSARIRAVFDFIAERALADTDLFERGTRSATLSQNSCDGTPLMLLHHTAQRGIAHDGGAVDHPLHARFGTGRTVHGAPVIPQHHVARLPLVKIVKLASCGCARPDAAAGLPLHRCTAPPGAAPRCAPGTARRFPAPCDR